MDGCELEASPFFFNQGRVPVQGRTRDKKLPVVVKRYDFVLIQEKQTQVSIVRTLNTALARPRCSTPTPATAWKLERTSCSVLEALDTDLGQDIEDQPTLYGGGTETSVAAHCQCTGFCP